MGESFTSPDARQLGDETLVEARFPASAADRLRVFFDPVVHTDVWNHASELLSHEICGVLVGQWERDTDGPFLVISGMIRADAADSKFAEVTFTHEAWAKINREMDSRFTDRRVVGWYHSHPDFGVFLSDRDLFIHEHFFSGPGQIAQVVDPVRRREGVFVWRDGKPVPCRCFWVGDEVHIDQSQAESLRSSKAGSENRTEATVNGSVAASSAEVQAWLPPVRTLLAYVGVFLLGLLIAGLRSHWEQRMLVEGVAAHYGLWKGLRPGLRRELDDLDARLHLLATDIDRLNKAPESDSDGTSDSSRADAKAAVVEGFRLTRLHLQQIEATYCLSSDEESVVARLLAARLAELQRLSDKSGQKATPEQPQQPRDETMPASRAASQNLPAQPKNNIKKQPQTPPATTKPLGDTVRVPDSTEPSRSSPDKENQ